MKSEVKEELIALANNILEQKEQLDLISILVKARQVYEKAILMNYLERNGGNHIAQTPPEPVSQPTFTADTKPSAPPQTPTKPIQEELPKDDFLSAAAIDVIFEDKREAEKRKSLNDNFSKSNKIGLNDRIGFIKHLFGGNESAFFDTLRKLDQAPSLEAATQFVKMQIKPQYQHWQGKEEYEERFMGWIANRFE